MFLDFAGKQTESLKIQTLFPVMTQLQHLVVLCVPDVALI